MAVAVIIIGCAPRGVARDPRGRGVTSRATSLRRNSRGAVVCSSAEPPFKRARARAPCARRALGAFGPRWGAAPIGQGWSNIVLIFLCVFICVIHVLFIAVAWPT